MSTVEGRCGITAVVICDSVSDAGIRLITYEISYPRMVHSELMTHRMLSRNAASSRAIPVAKMLEQLTAKPVRFGKNVSGMQDSGDYNASIAGKEFNPETNCTTYAYNSEQAWEAAKEDAIFWSKAFADAGYHKQVFNRLTEPFSMIKVVVTATEWDNFFWLRNDNAADPTLHELARLMFEAKDASTPKLLQTGMWHLPYIDCSRLVAANKYYLNEDSTEEISLEDAIKVSCARCAAVSFRNTDYGLEKSREVYSRLISSDRIHGSALEHCATPMKPTAYQCLPSLWTNDPRAPESWEQGISHTDRAARLWSGNFRGFIQFRKLIPGENYIT